MNKIKMFIKDKDTRFCGVQQLISKKCFLQVLYQVHAYLSSRMAMRSGTINLILALTRQKQKSAQMNRKYHIFVFV